jgi:site-specific recombinase XerC
MSVYRRQYKTAKKSGKSRFYSVEFRTPDGTLVRKSTRCTSKRAAEAMETRLRGEHESVHVGITSPAESKRDIKLQVDEFVAYLLTDLHRDADYCRIAKSRLLLMASEAGWRRLRDVSLVSFESWRRTQDTVKRLGRKPKPKTINQFLDIARRFLVWAKRRGKIKNNPLLDAEKASIADNPNYRRAGTLEEFSKLLEAVKGDPDRQRFYRWAIYVPLRRATHKALTWGDLHERDARPWVAIRAETIKDRKYIPLPLRADVATMLRDWRVELGPKSSDKLFPNVPTLKEIQVDLAAAGVKFSDEKGLHRLDLHAFRKTALRWMRRAGVPLEDAAAILQHKDIRTTKRYYDEEPDAMSLDVVEKMPGIPEGGKS